MLLDLVLPRVVELMEFAKIDIVYASEGLQLGRGAKLLDLTVDLSASLAHDCPPISHYRIAMGDQVWLRRIHVAPGETVPTGARIALCSTEPDEPLDQAPARALRVSMIAITAPFGFAGARA